MKKDIEWLKETLEERIDTMAKFEDVSYSIGLKEAYQHTLLLINQLDEPETLSKEWIDWHKEFVGKRPDGTRVEVVKEQYLQNLLVPKEPLGNSQELEKVQIPQFVAEYLDFAKSDTTLMRVLELANTRNEWEKWEKEYDWIEENHELFARAWLDGYTVEEEQKYYARIKGWKNVTTGSKCFNWVYFKEADTVGISKAVENKYQAVSFTKDDWESIGVNEHNADFVKVEELEE